VPTLTAQIDDILRTAHRLAALEALKEATFEPEDRDKANPDYAALHALERAVRGQLWAAIRETAATIH
jgi:hypothetical protein